MTANVEDLKRAISNGHDYFQAGGSIAIDYIRQIIRPALREAIKDAKHSLLSEHDVDTKSLNNAVHYTSLQALFAMLVGRAEPSTLSEGARKGDLPTDQKFLRLYNSATFNDPSEGAYFMKRFTRAYDVVHTPAYIASFVTPDKSTDDTVTNTRDNLVFWKHYGDDGQGCSISIQTDRLIADQNDVTLRSVTYGSLKADKAANQFRPIVQDLDKLISDDSYKDLQREVAMTILESLGEIPYLYKSRAYEYEKECRLIAMESTFKDYGGICHEFEERFDKCGRIRMYGQHPRLNLTNILSTGTVLTLGPAVPNADYVQYAIEQLLRSLNKEGLPIERSEIPYRRT